MGNVQGRNRNDGSSTLGGKSLILPKEKSGLGPERYSLNT